MTRERSALEKAAGHAQDMTVADVHTVLGALLRAMEEMSRSRDRGIPDEVTGGTAAARTELGRRLSRRHRKPLPDAERQVSPTGRRLRVLVLQWGEWANAGDLPHALLAVLVVCDAAMDGAGLDPFLVYAAKAARHEVEALSKPPQDPEAEAWSKPPAAATTDKWL